MTAAAEDVAQIFQDLGHLEKSFAEVELDACKSAFPNLALAGLRLSF